MKEREAQRRALILKAVRACVAEGGLAGATMRRIARKAQISTGMLTYYYANKRELILDALTATGNRRYERSREIAGPESSPRRIAAYFDVAFAEDDDEVASWPFTLEYWAEATRDPELRKHHQERRVEGRETMAGHIRTAMDAGEVRRDLDPYALADLFLALRKGLGVEIAIGEEEMDAHRARELAEVMIELVRPGGTPEGIVEHEGHPQTPAASSSAKPRSRT